MTDIPPSNALRITHGGGRQCRRTGFLLAPKGLKPFEIATLGRILTDAASNLILLGGNGQCSMRTTPSITVIFKVGTDMNTALMLTHNRVQDTLSRLPEEVQLQGVQVKKTIPALRVHPYSPDGSRSAEYISNYFVLNVRDQIARLPGVANFWVLGERQYAMRIWIQPALSISHLSSATQGRLTKSTSVPLVASAHPSNSATSS